jgi:hypothetical protein
MIIGMIKVHPTQDRMPRQSKSVEDAPANGVLRRQVRPAARSKASRIKRSLG